MYSLAEMDAMVEAVAPMLGLLPDCPDEELLDAVHEAAGVLADRAVVMRWPDGRPLSGVTDLRAVNLALVASRLRVLARRRTEVGGRLAACEAQIELLKVLINRTWELCGVPQRGTPPSRKTDRRDGWPPRSPA